MIHTLKYQVLIIVLSLGTLVVGQTTATLNFNDFMKQVKKNHPLAMQAEIQLEEGDAYLQKSRGMFDPKAYYEMSQKYFEDKEYYHLNNSGLKIPTWFGVELEGGYQLNDGLFLNPQNSLPNAGLWHAGASINLGKGLFIDERRAELKKAKLFLKSSEAERQNLYNELLYNAGKAYWDWFTAFHTMKTYEEALRLAIERLEAVKQNALFGDVPAIDTVEAGIQVQNRQVSYEQSILSYKNSSAYLAVFLWDKGIAPLELDENLQPEILENMQPLTVANEVLLQLDSVAFTHPELVQYNVKLQQLELETRLKKEMLKPMLNLKYNALAEPVGNDVFSNYNSNNYNWGVAFSMPLFLRKERGELNLAQLKLQETTLDIAIKRAGVNFKAQAAINELATTFNQTNIYLRTVKDYELLLNGEKQKFAAGESSLFMVNARETGFISTQLKLIELMAKNQKAQLAVDFAIGQLYQKF